MTITISHYLAVAAALFVIGAWGVIMNRRNLIVTLLSIELMLLAVNLNLVSFANYLSDMAGQVFTLLVLSVAAAEAAIGLAIVVVYHRKAGSIAVERASGIKG